MDLAKRLQSWTEVVETLKKKKFGRCIISPLSPCQRSSPPPFSMLKTNTCKQSVLQHCLGGRGHKWNKKTCFDSNNKVCSQFESVRVAEMSQQFCPWLSEWRSISINCFRGVFLGKLVIFWQIYFAMILEEGEKLRFLQFSGNSQQP